MCRMLDSTRADFLFLSLVPRDERGREFTGGQGSRRLKRCFVEVERKGFSDFSFLFFLSFPLPPLPFHRGTRFAKIPRVLYLRVCGEGKGIGGGIG